MSIADIDCDFSPVSYVCDLDVSDLAKVLADNPDLFGQHDWRKYRKESGALVHGDMSDIWVRYNDFEKMGDGFNDEHSSVWYPVINEIPEVLRICALLMTVVAGERLGGVLITKLPAGGKIAPHIDRSWHADYYQKFFVPIANDKGAAFCWDGVKLEPKAGEVWEFDNSEEHWVQNKSDVDRIAMIVCIKTMESSLNAIK